MKPTVLLSFAAFLLGAASPAFAQNAQEEAALRQFCTGDYMRLCSNFDPGSKEVEACFKQKMSQLTPQCRSTIASFQKNNPQGRGK